MKFTASPGAFLPRVSGSALRAPTFPNNMSSPSSTSWPSMPVVGDPTAFRFNIVPRDFVVDAIDALSANEHSRDRNYQLADPHPLTVDELYREMGRAMGRRIMLI